MKKTVLLLFVFLGIISLGHSQNTVTEKLLTKNTSHDRYASYSPNGKKIVFESNRDGHWEIYMMDNDGKNQQRLTIGKYDNRRPSWHPTGEKIIFESNRSGAFELYELTLTSKSVKKIKVKNLQGVPMFAKYSSDGTKIAFSLMKSDTVSNIQIVSHKGTFIKAFTNYNYRSVYPNWSRDDRSILFFSRHETNNTDDEIYIMNLDGSSKKRLTNWPKHNFCPAWSKDGKKIAYVTSMKDIRPEIYIMDSDGKNQTRITYNNDGDTLPNWSPDGKKLLITGYRNGNFEICELTIR